MVDRAKTKHTPIGSFLIHIESEIVCLESGTVRNASGAAISEVDMVGYPVKDTGGQYELALEVDSAAGIVGWIVSNGLLNLENNEITERKLAILARGPAAINGDALPANDVAGTPFTTANLVAAAEGANIQVRYESPQTSTQVT